MVACGPGAALIPRAARFKVLRGIFRIVLGYIVAISKADKADEYIRYAEHCVKTLKGIPEWESRVLHREMAGEWIRLAHGMMEEAAVRAQPMGQRRKTSRA
jgi:hypothetical protein